MPPLGRLLKVLNQASTSNINGAKLPGTETNKIANRPCRETFSIVEFQIKF